MTLVITVGVLATGEQPVYSKSLSPNSSERQVNCGECSASLFLGVRGEGDASVFKCPQCGHKLSVPLLGSAHARAVTPPRAPESTSQTDTAKPPVDGPGSGPQPAA